MTSGLAFNISACAFLNFNIIQKVNVMSMDLVNENGQDWRFTTWAYCNALRLAEKYGWKRKYELDYYFSNDGQTVDREDAYSIGDALLSALDDIPDREARALQTALNPMDLEEVTKYQRGEKIAYKSILEVFSGKNKKEAITDFAMYCQSGSFKVF